jgi:hypothetical protein
MNREIVRGAALTASVRRLAGVLLVLGGIGATAPPANAGLLVKSAPDCTGQVLEQPFKPWLDNAQYTLVPGGTFEAGVPSWQLSKANVASGNEVYYVHDQGDSRSLVLRAGGVATSPTSCVGLEHPTMRLFARSSGLLPLMEVEALVETSVGSVVPVPIGVVTPSAKWRPTLPFLVVGNLLPLLPGEHTPVAFRFRAVTGTWTIDDVYVDPKRR